ncbi:hypothetical protein B0H14DRAFT_2790689 [Mycena olivaceomarginata]|nr:hypothetical protein B0H14DRAFT_2790689 [Mycena olivaceomarginata]
MLLRVTVIGVFLTRLTFAINGWPVSLPLSIGGISIVVSAAVWNAMKKKLHSSQDRLPEEGGEGEDVGRETEAEEEEAGVITAEIEAITSGGVHVTLRPILPANLTTTDQRIKWINGFFWKISRDMRHTADWRCEFCTKEAREIVKINATWMRLDPPRAKSYIHNVCDANTGPCAEVLRIMETEMARLNGLPPTLPPTTQTRRKKKNHPLACQRMDLSRHKVCCKAIKEIKWYWP